jgi:Kef-type K+ transport system membrane component KefB
LLTFVILILVVRGVPIFLASWLERDPPGGPRMFTRADSLRIALYGATGLPIIVAVTSVAVNSGQMTDHHASLLVAGGAITVLALPMAATLLGGGQSRPSPAEIVNDAKPAEASDHGG